MTALSTLRARVEACGAGGDREIDLDLAKFLGEAPANAKFDERERIFTGNSGAFMFYAVVPPYTSSIDAALALVERKLPARDIDLEIRPLMMDGEVNAWTDATIYARAYARERNAQAHAATPALALLSALLLALEGQDT